MDIRKKKLHENPASIKGVKGTPWKDTSLFSTLSKDNIVNITKRLAPRDRNIMEAMFPDVDKAHNPHLEKLQTQRHTLQRSVRWLDVFDHEAEKKLQEIDTLTKKIDEFKKGGKVKKTGLALVHKGEVVIPAHRVETVDKALKKAGLKPLRK
jgi:hypothetical protein